MFGASSRTIRQDGGSVGPAFWDHKIEEFHAVASEAEFDPDPSSGESAANRWLARAHGPAILPAILTTDTGKWFKGLMSYLSTYKTFANREATPRPDALDEFFPLTAIVERTKSIDGSSNDYSKVELERLNTAFLQEFGNPPTMNPIHNEGPKHYGPVYYPLIDYWMETEWHEVRHRMYGAESCILSSDWHMRDIFCF
jgi:hypothetical protein